jgi:hypothetical protein
MNELKKFNCSACKYATTSNNNLKKHFQSKKHELNINPPVDVIPTKFQCKKCNKYYKGHSGLWGHAKNCKMPTILQSELDIVQTKLQIEDYDNVMTDILQTLKDVKQDNLELKKMVLDLKENHQSSITTINNNNDITNNNTFNINVFLNEKCNKAINLDDFMKNMCYELADFNKMLEDYVEGSMSILRKNMSQIPLHKRPMHYLEGEDSHQQIFHIRQNDIWKTETEINWLKQINADDDDVLEKQTIYFALKQLDHDKLQYLRYNFSANHDYMKHHKRLNCEVTRVDKKMKLYDEVIKMIKLDH